MKSKDIVSIRLQSQGLATGKFKSPHEVVRWMGAMQAQDLAMVKWAVGSRSAKSTIDHFDKAFNEGKIIRTHLLRPTWHIVAAEDVYWMLTLSAPQILASMKSRHRQLGMTDKIVLKAMRAIEKVLKAESFATRTKLVEALLKAKIPNEDNRAAHLLAIAELEGIICSGPLQGNDQTYAFLEERVPKKKLFTREESLAQLAGRYFTSRAPATLEDFIWWSGLSPRDGRLALESIQSKLIMEQVGDKKFYLNSSSHKGRVSTKSFLLAAFDEMMISYRDRSALLDSTVVKKVISKNGIFWPVVLIKGKAAGLWKRTIAKETIQVDFDFFRTCTQQEINSVAAATRLYGKFIGKKLLIKR